MQVQSLGEEMATHSSLLAWRIPWTEEPGGYSPWGPKEPNMTERLNSKNFASSLHLTHAGCFPRERRGLNRCSGVEGPRGGSRGSISVRPRPQRAESLAGTRWGWDNHTQVHQAVGGGGGGDGLGGELGPPQLGWCCGAAAGWRGIPPSGPELQEGGAGHTDGLAALRVRRQPAQHPGF